MVVLVAGVDGFAPTHRAPIFGVRLLLGRPVILGTRPEGGAAATAGGSAGAGGDVACDVACTVQVVAVSSGRTGSASGDISLRHSRSCMSKSCAAASLEGLDG